MLNNKLYFNFSIPNVMTICRIMLTPFFVVMLLREKFVAALFVFVVAAISDGLDGFIARYFNQRTTLGAYLDPVADKLLLVSAFVCLSVLRMVPEWLAVVVVVRECLISFGIFIFVITKKPYKVSPSILSKCNTFTQICMVFESVLILEFPEFNFFHYLLCLLTSMITILSGMQYVWIWVSTLQDMNRNLGTDR